MSISIRRSLIVLDFGAVSEIYEVMYHCVLMLLIMVIINLWLSRLEKDCILVIRLIINHITLMSILRDYIFKKISSCYTDANYNSLVGLILIRIFIERTFGLNIFIDMLTDYVP